MNTHFYIKIYRLKVNMSVFKENPIFVFVTKKHAEFAQRLTNRTIVKTHDRYFKQTTYLLYDILVIRADSLLGRKNF